MEYVINTQVKSRSVAFYTSDSKVDQTRRAATLVFSSIIGEGQVHINILKYFWGSTWDSGQSEITFLHLTHWNTPKSKCFYLFWLSCQDQQLLSPQGSTIAALTMFAAVWKQVSNGTLAQISTGGGNMNWWEHEITNLWSGHLRALYRNTQLPHNGCKSFWILLFFTF